MKYTLIVLILIMAGCGDKGHDNAPLSPTCEIVGWEDNYKIVCPNGEAFDPYAGRVTPVQFCPGTTTYASNFQEVGLCIDNNLYAVYSANNGFLTYLPPGVYQSNAVGNSCTFTVLPNCQVQ